MCGARCRPALCGRREALDLVTDEPEKHDVLKANVIGPEKIDDKSVEFLGWRMTCT